MLMLLLCVVVVLLWCCCGVVCVVVVLQVVVVLWCCKVGQIKATCKHQNKIQYQRFINKRNPVITRSAGDRFTKTYASLLLLVPY